MPISRVLNKSKKESKDQESIQLNTISDPRQHIGKWRKTQVNSTYKRAKKHVSCQVVYLTVVK